MKKYLKIFLVLIPLLFWGSSVHAQATVTESGNTVMVSEIDSNWTFSASCMMNGDGSGRKMNWILFSGASAWGLGSGDSYIVIKDGSVTGPIIYYSQVCALATDQTIVPIYYFGQKLKPVIDFSSSSVAHDQSFVIFSLWPD